MGGQAMISKHIFLFPFRWDYKKVDSNLYELPLKERLNFTKAQQLINSEQWIKSRYHENSPVNYYNDATYYLEYVRPAMFEMAQSGLSPVSCFEYNSKNEQYFYEIDIKTNALEKTYTLKTDRITLNIYNTGIGILGFHLSNDIYSDKDDILRINDFGRRIYPQFLDTSVDKSGKSTGLLNAAKNAFLPNYIKIYSENNIIYEECFEQFNNDAEFIRKIKENPSHLPNDPVQIASFIGTNFRTISNCNKSNEEIIIRPILDDRNFVVCWYGNDQESSILKLEIPTQNSDTTCYAFATHEKNDFWLKYIFVDNSGNTLQSKNMRKEYALRHTYDRWIDYGALYGISRYSFVCLTALDFFSIQYISEHVSKRYFEFIQLALAQRSSIIKFSDEATLIAGKTDEQITEDAEFLHKQYMIFVNRLYFRDVTAQEQGIEMYQLLTSLMELERDKQMLNMEIDELHQFVNLEQQNNQSKEAMNLTRLASLILPSTLIAGILGINFLTAENIRININSSPDGNFIIALLIILFPLFVSFIYPNWLLNCMNFLFKKKK